VTSAPPLRPDDRVAVARSDAPHRWRKLVLPATVASTLVTATVALHLRDPHIQGAWGICPTKAVLGFECPGCGGLRAVNDLTNLQLVEAASSNLAFVVSIPLLAYVFARWTIGRWRGQAWDPSDRAMNWSALALVVGLTVFTVLRNVPAGAWLAP
jgi:hypothetical protein